MRLQFRSLLAAVSLLVLTGISTIREHMHDKVGDLGRPSESGQQLIEKLTASFDKIATDYQLRCTPCDSLTEGRLYVGERPSRAGGVTLLLSYSVRSGMVYYQIRAAAMNRPIEDKSRIDAIKDAVEAAIRQIEPSAALAAAPQRANRQMGVWLSKAHPPVSHNPAAHSDDVRDATVVFEETAKQFGLRGKGAKFHFGRRVGVDSYEFTVHFSVADSPLIMVSTISAAAELNDLQDQFAKALEHRYKQKFGEQRASIR